MIEKFSPSSRNQSAEGYAKKEFSLIPEGLYQVQLHDIVEKQKPDFKNPSVLKNFFTFTFIILNEGELRGRRLWLDVSAVPPYPPSEGRKQSWMYKVISAIEKHSITQDEAGGYDAAKFNTLIGEQIQVVVKHSPPKASGKVYANIDSVMAASSKMEAYETPKKEIVFNTPDIQIDNSDLPF